MRAVAAGDTAAFSLLYDLLSVATYSVLLKHLPMQADADRAMKAMWLFVWRNAATLSSTSGSVSDQIMAAAQSHALERGIPAA